MDLVITEFLSDLSHGPAGSVNLGEYEKHIRSEATRHLETIANDNLSQAGAYGRTIDRWWAGFYTGYVKPTISYTAKLTPYEIGLIISQSSRRG